MTDSPQVITRMGLSLFVILTGSFIAPLLMHSSTLAIPAIAAELRLDAEALSWFTLLNILASVCFVLPAGKLADIYGRKKILSIGLLVSALACLFGGLAHSEWALLSGRFLQGVGGAFIFGSAVALVSGVPPEDKKAQVMGIYIAVAYLGIVSGPLFGGAVLTYLDWRWIFYIPAAILFVTAAIGFFALTWERYGDRNGRLRFLDTSLYMGSLILIALAVFRTHELSGQLLLLLGIVSFVGFYWFQTKRRDPLLQVALFRDNSVFTTLGLTHLFSYSGILAMPFTITLYLRYILDIDAQTTGFVLISQALFTAMISPLSGWLAARFRVRYILYFGMTILVLGMGMLVMLDPQSSLWVLLGSMSAVGLAIGIIDPQLFRTCIASVDEKHLGSASATLNGLRTMGGFVGIAIVSYLMGSIIGKQEITPALYPDLMTVLHSFFVASAALTLFSFCLLRAGFWMRDREATANGRIK